ncbi:MAG: DUF2911 domain-containing protein [Bacteroidota bacterium]|nr:DUF2911 domain-containing protein [Bacteroidota bacterium]
MKKIFFKGLVLTLVGMLMTSLIFAQQDKSKRASPPETATGNVSGSTITINYSSPAVKGRKIWGGLVPYDKVWRLGANEATTFKTSKDIMVEGKKLPAGTYALYALPTPTEWTFIFNSKLTQAGKPIWGIKDEEGNTTDDPKTEVLRIMAKPMKSSAFNERMKFVVGGSGFTLEWENLKVPVSVK